MTLIVTRSNIRLNPDYKKVIPRFFNTGNERSLLLINKVLQMDDEEVEALLNHIFREFSGRYRNIQAIFLKHFNLIKYLLADKAPDALAEKKKLLIGSYFTMEYSIEAAALFNPSIVEDPKQDGAGYGQKKVIVSFRATGESHISSIVFKRGTLDESGMIYFEPSGSFLGEGIVTELYKDNKINFENVLSQMVLPEDILPAILCQLQDTFSYKEIEVVLKNALMKIESATEKTRLKYEILSRVNTSYELQFPADSLLSERVIFPVTIIEKNGIEDARFVKFREDDGTFNYIATYTAYDGSFILPQLIITTDFCHFKIKPLHGKAAINKNLALFPRKINGQYVMLSRIDGINNYIMFSDDIHVWEEAILLQQPKYAWELVQIGNAGAPIETEAGWLVITHGVGPMRKYCLGASLFDLADPTIELGRLKEPLLMPNEEERNGYVPNVVYSCGSIIHGDKLIIPYAVSDYASSFASVLVTELLEAIMSDD
ncbi:glycosidase [Ilyomonas limi]|uniref:Glycosidase n=1 Tax=Ilyomonas limi TaxID=2575867 RepID=A0A4U3KPT7_9BACT|nr:glycoside hydrolase family 130 protein [Ilyomonas limi]TKK64190.1 glycosidase [Ilyomonas limi]